MPKRKIDIFDNPPAPGKRLLAKVKNFLVNKGIIGRDGFVLDHSVQIEYEYESKGRMTVNIYGLGPFVQSYSASLRKIEKAIVFTWTESYQKPVSDFLSGWVQHVSEVLAVPEHMQVQPS